MPRAAKVVQLPSAPGAVGPRVSLAEPPERIQRRPDALHAWQVMAQHLAERGITAPAYVLAMEMAAGAYADAIQAQRMMAEHPDDCHYPVHAHRAAKLFLEYSKQFGLTVTAGQQVESAQLRLRWDRASSEVL